MAITQVLKHSLPCKPAFIVKLALTVVLALLAVSCQKSQHGSSAVTSFAYPQFWPVPELKVPADAKEVSQGPLGAVYKWIDGNMVETIKISEVFFTSMKSNQSYFDDLELVLTPKGFTVADVDPGRAASFYFADRTIRVYFHTLGENFHIVVHQATDGRPFP